MKVRTLIVAHSARSFILHAVAKIEVQDVRLILWDLGGEPSLHGIREQYCKEAHGFIHSSSRILYAVSSPRTHSTLCFIRHAVAKIEVQDVRLILWDLGGSRPCTGYESSTTRSPTTLSPHPRTLYSSHFPTHYAHCLVPSHTLHAVLFSLTFYTLFHFSRSGQD